MFESDEEKVGREKDDIHSDTTEEREFDDKADIPKKNVKNKLGSGTKDKGKKQKKRGHTLINPGDNEDSREMKKSEISPDGVDKHDDDVCKIMNDDHENAEKPEKDTLEDFDAKKSAAMQQSSKSSVAMDEKDALQECAKEDATTVGDEGTESGTIAEKNKTAVAEEKTASENAEKKMRNPR